LIEDLFMAFKQLAVLATFITMSVVPTTALHAQSADAKPDCSKLSSASMDHANMDHTAPSHMSAMQACAGALPTQAGQAAFGAISEIVRMLDADPNTDWSRVNIEALRQHLIDMDDVTMHAVVSQRSVPGGVEMTVTGSGRTAGAIKRMAVNHRRMLDQESEYHATATERSDGAIITVMAKDSSDARLVARIRGLGFAGLMTQGEHHAAHHLAIARGDADPHGHR
jgi:hypothetical protein